MNEQEGPALQRLRGVRLRPTVQRVAILQELLKSPAHWMCAETIYRLVFARSVPISLATIYRVLQGMKQRGLVLRDMDASGKRFFRLHADEDHSGVNHRVLCRDSGRFLSFRDDMLRLRLTAMLRQHGLELSDEPITLQITCNSHFKEKHGGSEALTREQEERGQRARLHA